MWPSLFRSALTVAALLAIACSGPTDDKPLGQLAMAITGGDGQTDTVTQTLLVPLEVQVTRLPADIASSPVAQPGIPVRNVTVSFAVVEGPQCGRPLSASVVTDANGKARQSWELGTAARICHMEVIVIDEVLGAEPLRDTFNVRAVAGPPASIERTLGPPTGVVGDTIEVGVRVTDAHGNAVSGEGITWTPATGSGNIIPISARTDQLGIALARWILTRRIGDHSMTAAVAPGVTTTFTTFTTVGPVARVIKVSGDNQVSYSDRPPALPLVVRYEDQYGNPVEGIYVTWSGPSTIQTPSTSVTGADGLASTQWIGKPGSLGSVTLTATGGTFITVFQGRICGPYAGGC